MSADNGVYVLVSRGRKTQHGHKKEYRVILDQGVNNIFQGYDGTWPISDKTRLDLDMVRVYFGKARVFNDRKLAEAMHYVFQTK